MSRDVCGICMCPYDDSGTGKCGCKEEPTKESLKDMVKSFFKDYLDVTEESDNGKLFHPVQVSCCRAMMTEPLNDLLVKMKREAYE